MQIGEFLYMCLCLCLGLLQTANVDAYAIVQEHMCRCYCKC